MKLLLGISLSTFALPFAVEFDMDDDWGTSTVFVYVGPFVIGLEWRAAA